MQLDELYLEACQPMLREWIEANPARAAALTPADLDELLSLQGTGGPLTSYGVEFFVDILERRKAAWDKLVAISGTEWFEHLEMYIGVLFDKIQVSYSRVA